MSNEWPVRVLDHRQGAWPGFAVHALRVSHDRPTDFVRRLGAHSLFFNMGARPVRMESRIEGGPVRRTPLPSHAWTLVPAGMTLRGVIGVAPAFEHVSVLIEDGAWRAALEEAGVDCAGLELVPRLGAADPAMLESARKLRRALATDGAIGRLYGAQVGAVMLTELALQHSTRPFALPHEARGGLSPRSLRRVLEALNEAGPEGPPAEGLVALSGVSRGHFFRAFKQSTGRSPERYLTELRVRRAAEMLAGRAVVSDEALAGMVGFASPRQLRAAFRRVTGQGLAAFRAELP